MSKASPRFAELDAYSRAAVTALLDKGRSNLTAEEETHYLTSAGELINRVLGLGDNRESDQERELAIRREADEAVLALLQYGAMNRRRDDIEQTFDSSCQWLFEEPVDDRWASFPQWMVNGSGLYYLITGKEASGKSTLMKYVSTHARTAECLTEWARPVPLVVAAFYFWRSGTRLEKSEEGLLRSLLHSVLRQQPSLMPTVFPGEWSMFYASVSNDRNPLSAGLGAWRVDHLRDAFRRLVRQDRVPLKLFFLIDGIDEYQHEDGNDNFTNIMEFFKNEIVTSTNTKALVSSRPLEAFGTLGIQPQLSLHDLNQQDISTYVNKTLNNHDVFRKENERHKQDGDDIIRYILESSNGVFLWAVLSIKTVLSKLEEGETLANTLDDLRVQAMPILNDLYQRMWSTIPITVKRRASQTVLVMLSRTDITQSGPGNGKGAPRLIDLALALGDSKETIRSPVMKWPGSRDWVQTKCNRLTNDFMMTWPGFITIAMPGDGDPDWDPTSTIRYCHRSVPDYLREQSNSILADATESALTFYPRIALLKSAVQQLKCLPPRTRRQYLWAFATTAFLVANEIDSEHNPTESLDQRYLSLLEELDCTLQHHHDHLQKGSDGRYLETKLQDPHGIVGLDDRGRDSKRIARMHWSNFHFDPECSHPRRWEDSFLSLAIQFGLRNYVEAKLGKGSTEDKVSKSKRGRPLLDYALVPSRNIAPYDLVKSTLIKTLLDHGADPNERFEGQTCWERALIWQYETYPSAVNATGATLGDARKVAEDRVKTFPLLVNQKADKRAFITSAKGRKVSARKVLEESFRPRPHEAPLQGFKSLMDSFPKDDAGMRGIFLFSDHL